MWNNGRLELKGGCFNYNIHVLGTIPLFLLSIGLDVKLMHNFVFLSGLDVK